MATTEEEVDERTEELPSLPGLVQEDPPPEPEPAAPPPALRGPRYEITLPSGRIITVSSAEFKIAGGGEIRGDFPDDGARVRGTWEGIVTGTHGDQKPRGPVTRNALLSVVKVTDATLEIVPAAELAPELPFDGEEHSYRVDAEVGGGTWTVRCTVCDWDTETGEGIEFAEALGLSHVRAAAAGLTDEVDEYDGEELPEEHDEEELPAPVEDDTWFQHEHRDLGIHSGPNGDQDHEHDGDPRIGDGVQE
jgi:hypothetical protein